MICIVTESGSMMVTSRILASVGIRYSKKYALLSSVTAKSTEPPEILAPKFGDPVSVRCPFRHCRTFNEAVTIGETSDVLSR